VLAADPGVLALSGRTLIGAEVAQRYGISETFPKGTSNTGDLSYARPLRLDSPSLFWDGETR
jgi:hypothetical protein